MKKGRMMVSTNFSIFKNSNLPGLIMKTSLALKKTEFKIRLTI